MSDQSLVEIVGKESFDQNVIKADRPVLVDFYADWCPPCKKLKPILQLKAKASNGTWKLAAVNVDDNDEIASLYQVSGIPHCVLIVNGQTKDQFTGFKSEEQIDDFLAKYISK